MGTLDLRQLASRLARPLQWLLALAIVWTLVDTAWFFLGGAETESVIVDTPQSTERDNGAMGAGFDLDQITQLDLFGRPAAGGTEQIAMDAPATRLRLELQGVFLAASDDRSSAIVAERNNSGQLYFVGDPLPGNAELVRVLADRIVLRRGGSMETLRFPEAQLSSGFVSHGGTPDDPEPGPAEPPGVSTIPPDSAVITGGEPTTAGQAPARPQSELPDGTQRDFRATVNEYRQRLQTEPDNVMRELGVESVSVGDETGLRVDSVASAAELARVGLRSGDVVLSVNGQGVDMLQSNPAEIDQIMDSGSARLEIQRGDRRFFVTTRIPGQ